jgi:hypothetical protein
MRLLVLFFLGIFSCAAVATVAALRDRCENVYLTADDRATHLTDEKNGARLIDGQQCRLPLWGMTELRLRLHLPPQLAIFVVSD